jgi:hypothetical protein
MLLYAEQQDPALGYAECKRSMGVSKIWTLSSEEQLHTHEC